MFNKDKIHANDPKKACINTDTKKDTQSVADPKKDEHKVDHKKMEAVKK